MKAIALAAMLAVSAGSAGAATVIPSYLLQHARYDMWWVAVEEEHMLPGTKTMTIDYCYSYGCSVDTRVLEFFWTNTDIYFGLPTEPYFLARIPGSYSNVDINSLVVTTDYIPGVPLPASGFLIAVAVAALGLFRRRLSNTAVASSR